jgi:transcriptional regulator with XRE-family HTH domain
MSSGGNAGGTPRARALGMALRRARMANGMTLKQVAEAMNRNESHPSRWENGKLVPSAEDLGALLHILKITGDERESIIQLSREMGIPDWAAAAGNQFAVLLETEREATAITNVESSVIPGLLQTEDYAYNIIMAYSHDVVRARQYALVRIGRQAVLTRRQPPEYVAVIGEQALRYPPCNRPIMVEQLRHLLDVRQRPNITIVVMPLRVGRFVPGQYGSFVLFESAVGKPMLLLENPWSSTIITSMRAIDDYRAGVVELMDNSLGVEGSAVFIKEILEEMESEL